MNSFRIYSIASVLGLLFSGCATEKLPTATGPGFAAASTDAASFAATPEQGLDPALLQVPSEPYRLGPGDILEIEVMGNSADRATASVGPDGKIYYDLLPGLDVWGLTLTEARDRIVKGLQSYVREKPVVSVSLKTAASRRYWVLGRVGTPGVYALTGPTTLLDAVAQVGGLASSSALGALAVGIGINNPEGPAPEAADLGRAIIIRGGRNIPVDFQRLLRDGDMTQNIYLEPGDFVYFPSASVPEVHVLGAVVHPQSARLAGPLTAVEALAIAGGAAPGAYLDNVAIVRGSLTHPQIAIVQVSQVLKGRAPDVRLEAGDIVYVPSSPYSTVTRYVDLILDTFARTIGVNAGSHAAGSGATASVGVNVSVAP